MKFFIKLINNQKIEISRKNYVDYVANINDYMTVLTPKSKLIIKYSQILFAYTLIPKINYSICPKCKKKYDSELWGQCVLNNTIEFCCLDCKENIGEQ